jgi:hypothetical protein
LQKKTWYLTSLLSGFWFMALSSLSVHAQVNFRINTAADLNAGLIIEHQTTTLNSMVSVAATISIKTQDAYFKIGNTTTLLGSQLFTARVIGTNGELMNALSLGTPTPTVTLSTTDAVIYSSMIGLISSGPINLRYIIPQPKLFAWRAGTYIDNLMFSVGGLSAATLTPATQFVNCIVAPFISAPATQNIAFTINSLDYYNNTILSPANYLLPVTATVNHGIRLKTNTAFFAYTNGYSGATDPLTSGNVLSAQLISPVTASAIAPTTTAQPLTAAGGNTVPTGNTTTNTIAYSLSKNTLRNSFLKKGTYTINLNNEIFDTNATVSAASQTLNNSLTVIVNDLAQLKVNNNDVNLVFATAADYKNGVYIDMPAHVILSGTSPYDVFVQASTTALTNGSNTLPLNIIQIQPTADNPSDFTSITLSSGRQKILSALPVLDRQLGVRYKISAANAAQLLGKPAGTYNTVITYSLIAP